MRKADVLAAKMIQVNDQMNLVNHPPSEKEVAKWVTAVKKKKRGVEHKHAVVESSIER